MEHYKNDLNFKYFLSIKGAEAIRPVRIDEFTILMSDEYLPISAFQYIFDKKLVKLMLQEIDFIIYIRDFTYNLKKYKKISEDKEYLEKLLKDGD